MFEVQVTARASHAIDVLDCEVSVQASFEEFRQSVGQRHRRGHVPESVARCCAEETRIDAGLGRLDVAAQPREEGQLRVIAGKVR